MSIQSQINTERDGWYNEEKLEEYINIIKDENFIESEVDFKLLRVGDRIKYLGFVRDSDTIAFRSGGIVISIDTDKKWLAYKSFGTANFSLQESNVYRLWRKANKSEKQKKKKIVEFKLNQKYIESKFRAYIGNTLVYVARDNDRLQKFLESDKFQYAYDTGNFTVR